MLDSQRKALEGTQILNYKRDVSMSVSDAVEYIKKKTQIRRDSCARNFARALAQSNPELTFWQNTPPDVEDLTATQVTHVPEIVRQVWPAPITIDGRTIGPWILDVYAGSQKKVQYGNTWDEPYQFNYEAAFANDSVPPEVADLPQPLMRNFRADRTIMRSICTAAIESIKPRRKKTANIATRFLEDAAQQVAVTLSQGHVTTHSEIENHLRSLEDSDRDWSPPIIEIVFVSADQTESRLEKACGYDVIVVHWQGEEYETKSRTNSLDTFAKRVKKYMT